MRCTRPHSPLFPYTTLFRSPLVLVAALPVPIVNWITHPDPLARSRKRVQKLTYRTRKALSRAGSLTTHRVRRLARSWGKRSEEHTSELQSQSNLVCRLLLEK